MKNMHCEHVLVTGGAGFIGSHLAERLIQKEIEVTVLDNLITGKYENLSILRKSKGFQFIQGDIRDRRIVANTMKDVELLFHHAAVTGVSSSLADPTFIEEVNVIGTLNILESARKADVNRIIFASSAAVYGRALKSPCDEHTPLSPISPYGVTKMAAEHYCRVFYETYGLKSTALRYFNVYGPRQRADLEGGVAAIFISNLLNDQRPIIYGDGNNTRDFIYVHDVVEATLQALEAKIDFDIINIGTGIPTSILTLAEMISRLLGKEGLDPIFTQPRVCDIDNSWCDPNHAKKVLDFSADIPLKEGLRKTLDFQAIDE
ncbi:SDR family NAD(P)-dependent oxidoreductase [[Eubacterium] cellulosolvens]